MKALFYVLMPAVILASCGSAEEKKEEGAPVDSTATAEGYKAGEALTEDGALTADAVLASLKENDSVEVKLTAKVNSVCQAKGCWMRLDMGNGNEMMVKFKDYAFFVPKDSDGKTAIVQGWAKTDTLSVAELKEYASDAGKSKAEVDAITAPETQLTFEANGVLIK